MEQAGWFPWKIKFFDTDCYAFIASNGEGHTITPISSCFCLLNPILVSDSATPLQVRFTTQMKPPYTAPAMIPSVQPTIEVSQSALFEPTYLDTPSLPILSELGQGPIHRVVVYEGLIQLEKFARRFSRKITTSKA